MKETSTFDEALAFKLGADVARARKERRILFVPFTADCPPSTGVAMILPDPKDRNLFLFRQSGVKNLELAETLAKRLSQMGTDGVFQMASGVRAVLAAFCS